MCSLWPFSLDAEQEDEDLHVVVEKSGVTVMIDKEIEEISREEIVDETDSYQSNQSKLNERMHSCTIIDSIEPMDSSCLWTTTFLPQSNVFNSIDLIHEFFFNLIPHWHSISHPTPIWCQFMLQNSITSLMPSCHNAIWCPKWSTKQNPQDLQHHRHDSSAHIMCQLQVITNTCRAFVLILCMITGVLGIWHIVNQRYVLTFLMFLYISNLSYIHPENSESSTIQQSHYMFQFTA